LITLELDKPITRDWVDELRAALDRGLSPVTYHALVGLPLLHLVIGRNSIDATTLLIERGASFGPDRFGRWPSTIAARCEVGEELSDLVVEAEAAWPEKLEADQDLFVAENPQLGLFARELYDKVLVRVIRNVAADLLEGEVVLVGPAAERTSKANAQQAHRILLKGTPSRKVKIDGEDMVLIDASNILQIIDNDAGSSSVA
jgi:co-chaperonin GroES (HSP10)